eukprot:2220369-Rhodomonas_salina.2
MSWTWYEGSPAPEAPRCPHPALPKWSVWLTQWCLVTAHVVEGPKAAGPHPACLHSSRLMSAPSRHTPTF